MVFKWTFNHIHENAKFVDTVMGFKCSVCYFFLKYKILISMKAFVIIRFYNMNTAFRSEWTTRPQDLSQVEAGGTCSPADIPGNPMTYEEWLKPFLAPLPGELFIQAWLKKPLPLPLSFLHCFCIFTAAPLNICSSPREQLAQTQPPADWK